MDCYEEIIAMMTIATLKHYKNEYRYTNKDLAEMTGIPLGTINKIFSGESKNPRRENIERLEKVLAPYGLPPKDSYTIDEFTGVEGRDAELMNGRIYLRGNEYDGDVLRETGVYNLNPITDQDLSDEFFYMDIDNNECLFDKNKRYTIDDYYKLSGGIRAELINGRFYNMGSPSKVHQEIIGELYMQARKYINENKGKCQPILSPRDVQLFKNDSTIVIPDFMILCDASKDKSVRIIGAPDFVVEVISPATSRRDRGWKYNMYSKAGVREYWIVDSDKKKVIVYLFNGGDEDIAVYSLTDPIPVSIYDGKLKIDLSMFF